MAQPTYPPNAAEPYGASAPAAYGAQGVPSSPPPAPASYTPADGTLPQPSTAGEMKGEAPWCFFFGGLSLGCCAGWWSLIPLCVFSELKTDPRKRKYYLWGALPCLVLSVIIGIVLLAALIIPALVAAGKAAEAAGASATAPVSAPGSVPQLPQTPSFPA